MASIVASLAVLSFVGGEKVPEGGGLGWDGTQYSRMTRELGQMVRNRELAGYHAQRILPSAAVRGLLVAAGRAPTSDAAIAGFEAWNALVLLTCVGLWWAACASLGLGPTGRWVGFAGLFLCFMNSKHVFYNPVLTDTTAFGFGMAQLLLYLRRRPIALALASVAGSFAWPPCGLYGALLIPFTHRTGATAVGAEPPMPGDPRPTVRPAWPRCGAVAAAAILLAVAAAPLTGRSGLRLAASVVVGAATLSAIGCLAATSLLDGGSAGSWRRRIGRGSWRWVLAAGVALAGPLLARLISNPAIPDTADAFSLLSKIAVPAAKPLLFLVAHAVYLGPAVLLIVLYWPRFALQVRKLGDGARVLVAANLFLACATQSRFLSAAWPFFVAPAAMMLDGARVPRRFQLAFAACVLVFSRGWLVINVSPWPGGSFEGFGVFPKQMYFMHLGEWMSWSSYAWQGALVTASALLLLRLGRDIDWAPSHDA